MIAFLLLLVLTGSFAGAATAVMQDASWAMVALGYLLGGWGGLLFGLPMAMRAASRLHIADRD